MNNQSKHFIMSYNLGCLLHVYKQIWAHDVTLFRSIRDLNYSCCIQHVRFLVDSNALYATNHSADFIDPVCNAWLLGWYVVFSDKQVTIAQNPEYFGVHAFSPQNRLKFAKKMYGHLIKTHDWTEINQPILEELITCTEIHIVNHPAQKTHNFMEDKQKKIIQYRFNDGRPRKVTDHDMFLILMKNKQTIKNWTSESPINTNWTSE